MNSKLIVIILTLLSLNVLQAQTNNNSFSGIPESHNNPQSQPPIPTVEEYAQALIDALGGAGPRLRQVVFALASYCGDEDRFFTGMGGNCDKLFFEAMRGNGAIVERVLSRLRPRELVQQGRTSAQIMSKQQANISSRLSQIRSGTANTSIAGVNISIEGNYLSMPTLSYMSDPQEDSTSYDGLVSPWGFFINGEFSSGDYTYADDRTDGFNFDTDGITVGVDYRFNNKTVAGLAIGYANFDSNVGTDINMNSNALTFSAYGSFNVTDNFYIDAKASYGQPDFDQKRAIQFVIDDNNTDLSAVGSTQGTQKSLVMSSGYQFNHNGWQLTPFVSAEYNKTTIDAFVETGADAFNVGFSKQNFQTTRFTFGVQANKAISLKHGVLIPSIGYQYITENQNNDLVFMRISGMPAGEFFESPTGFNDDTYSTGQVGLVFVGANGKQAFLQYSKVFGWDGFDRYTVSLGARFEF
jgi:uncharacterized protein YhjY with autotransporter beta-barrel domain